MTPFVLLREIVETDHYLPLPDRFEINEYQYHGAFLPLGRR